MISETALHEQNVFREGGRRHGVEHQQQRTDLRKRGWASASFNPSFYMADHYSVATFRFPS
jgi:hypothetical protein